MRTRREYLSMLGCGFAYLSGCQGTDNSRETTSVSRVTDSPESSTDTFTSTATETDLRSPTTESPTSNPTQSESTQSDEAEVTATSDDTDSAERTNEDTDTSDETETPEETDEPTESVVVEDITVQKAVTYGTRMGSGGVLVGDEQQYVVATVRSMVEDAEYNFSLETDAGTFDPSIPNRFEPPNWSVAKHKRGPVWADPYWYKEVPHYLAFTIPSSLDVSEPVIRVEGVETTEWKLPKEATRRLARPEPDFKLNTIETPDTLTRGEPLRVKITVTNVSDTNGRFLAAAYWPTKVHDDDESHFIEGNVNSGQTVTLTTEIETEYTVDYNPVELSISGYVDGKRSVQVEQQTSSKAS